MSTDAENSTGANEDNGGTTDKAESGKAETQWGSADLVDG